MVTSLLHGSGSECHEDRWVSRLTPRHGLVAVTVLAAALRLTHLRAESLWFDETYSVAFASRPLRDFSMFRLEGPPFTDRNLYHLLLHFWLSLGRGDALVRLLSVILGVGCVVLLYFLSAELFGEKAGLWCALLLAISPFHVWYSQEARMYILVSLLTLLSAYFSLGILDLSPRHGSTHHGVGWVGYVLCTTGALYTHLFSAFVVLAQSAFVVFLLLTHRVSWRVAGRWLWAQLGVLILVAPLLRGVFLQQQMGWWAWIDARYGRPTPFDLMDTAVTFSYGSTLGAGRIQRWIGMLAFVVAIIVGILAGRPRRIGADAILSLDRSVWFCLFSLILPLAAVYVSSQSLVPGNRNMYVIRYFLPFLPPYLLLAGRGTSRLSGAIPRTVLLAILLVVSGRSLYRMYVGEQKEDWRGAVGYITERLQANDLIFLVDEDISVPFDYYLSADTDGARVGAVDSVKVSPIWRGVTETAKLEALAQEATNKHHRVWLVLSHTPNRGLETALDQHPELERTAQRRFTGIDLVLYERVGA